MLMFFFFTLLMVLLVAQKLVTYAKRDPVKAMEVASIVRRLLGK